MNSLAKLLLYTTAAVISIYLLGVIALFAIIPLALLSLLVDKLKPKS